MEDNSRHHALTTPGGENAPLTGGMLIAAALVLASANFIAVLDTTIANVSVPNIAGGLGATSSQGTYVITSYAVAEAITVPLTGWLAGRFGAVRVFVSAMILFGLCSALCGLASSLNMLVLFRIFQGLAGGPLMPLSQTLLLRIFPKEKAGAAIGLWSMTTLIAPILGPILGGVLCDNWSWPLIFYINVPVALLCGYLGWQLLRRYESSLRRVRIDVVGLLLLITWVGALQLMLDEGKDYDWFASTHIQVLAAVAAIGFIAFLIWELTEAHPIVALRVFRHRGYAASVLTISLAFGAFFGATVLTPLWLQNYMGYTATSAGYVSAMMGILAVLVAPLAAGLSTKVDPRPLVFFGVIWLGTITLIRTYANVEMTFWDIAWPLLLQGIGMPFFFVPLTGLALSSVNPEEMESAAGVMNFMRTLSGAFATSVVTTSWEEQTRYIHAELAGLTDRLGDSLAILQQQGFSLEQARNLLDEQLQGQSVMLATNQIFLFTGIAFFIAAFAIWLAPKPARIVDAAGVH